MQRRFEMTTAGKIISLVMRRENISSFLSSRFGKFIKIHYDDKGLISGASTNHFLLEKSRIVGSAKNERNYHIFYQICAGLSDDLKEELALKPANEFYYLNQGNCASVAEIDDVAGFAEVLEAMDVMGIEQHVQKSIWTLLAAVLHLGELDFSDNGRGEATCNSVLLPKLAQLLHVTETELDYAFCKRTMIAGGHRGSVAEIALTVSEAKESRNGLAKAIYAALFDWLVSRINEATALLTSSGCKADSEFYIGILDIFGFESLETNSFEQLCINFANEMLQQQFNEHVFVYEQKLYVSEGIDWSVLEFKDNQACLDLIAAKPLGILPLLDEQAMIGRRASDIQFLFKLNTTHVGKHSHYSRPRFGETEFIIAHYAGPVTYCVSGFIAKNNDSLHKDLTDLMSRSTCEFTSVLIPPPAKPRSKMTGTMTVGRKFRDQMSNLMATLSTTDPSFIRCVKPNTKRLAGGWDASLILDQLKYLGVMETVRIRRSGFPVRRTFSHFYHTYKLLLGEQDTESKRDGCEKILAKLNPLDWQMGHKKVFLRDGQLKKLNADVRQVKITAATRIQTFHRMRSQVKQYQLIRRRVFQLQSWMRMKVARMQYQKLYACCVQLHAITRGFLARKRIQKIKQYVIRLQTVSRAFLARKRVHFMRISPIAATKIASVYKMHLHWRQFQHQRGCATIISASFKRYRARKAYVRLQRASRTVSAWSKGQSARQLYILKKNSALRLHAIARGCLARVFYRRIRAQIEISRLIRGFLVRRRLSLHERMVIRMQSYIRRKQTRTMYLKTRCGFIKAQAMVRQRVLRQEYLKKKRMATKIASIGRGSVIRRRYLGFRAAIVALESKTRSRQAKQRYERIREQVILIQSIARRYIAVNEYRESRNRVIRVQSWMRMQLATNLLRSYQQSVTIISSHWKRKQQRESYCFQISCVVRIQALIRKFQDEWKYQQSQEAIIKIQSICRVLVAKSCLRERLRAVGCLHQAAARYLARLEVKRLFAAAKDYDLAAVNQLGRKELINVRNRSQHYMTLLHVAAANGDYNLAKYLIEGRKQTELITSVDAFGNAPLHYACEIAHFELVQYLCNVLSREETTVAPSFLKPMTSGISGSTPVKKHRRMRSLTPCHSRKASQSSVIVTNTIHEGYLSIRRPAGEFKRRYVAIDPETCSIYKSSTSRIPIQLIELTKSSTFVHRSGKYRHSFEIRSHYLKSSKDSSGVLYLMAETEECIIEWMKQFRLVVDLYITYEPSVMVDPGCWIEWLNHKNKDGKAPLHMVIDSNDEGFEAVKITSWLIEHGASIMMKDRSGQTPLTLALGADREDLVETLMKKGASTAVDDVPETILDHIDPKSTLLSSPVDKFHKHCWYMSIFIGSVVIPGSLTIQHPILKLYVADRKTFEPIERIQETPEALIQDQRHLWWGNTYHMQHPIDHFSQGVYVVIELHGHNFQLDQPELVSWTYLQLNWKKLTTESIRLELYSGPVEHPDDRPDFYSTTEPAFIQLDLAVTH